MMDFPKLEFTLMPGTEDSIARGLVKLEKLSDRLQKMVFSSDTAKRAEEEWAAGNLAFFEGSIGLNRLLSLLLNMPKLGDDKLFQDLFAASIAGYPSRSAVFALMAWCKSNWTAPNIARYRGALQKAAQELGLIENGRSKLKFGIGPLLPELVRAEGADMYGLRAMQHDGGWNGLAESLNLKSSDISGAFFASSAKSYLRQTLERAHQSPSAESDVVAFLRAIYKSNLKGTFLYMTSLAIVMFERNGLPHEELQAFALSFVGDTNSARWREVSHLSKLEAETVHKAQGILEQWLNELFLERFWNIIDDPKRRRFWKRYQKHMRDVRLAISDSYFNSLPPDVKTMGFKKRIHVTTGNALLIFRIKNRVFIEFGERASGPLQVVLNDSQQESRLSRQLADSKRSDRFPRPINPQVLKFYSSTDQFLLEGFTYHFDFGKLNHTGGWEDKLDVWMKKRGI